MPYISQRLIGFIAVVIIAFVALAIGGKLQASGPSWITPTLIALEKVGPYDDGDTADTSRIDNLGCSKYDYLAPDVTGGTQTLHGCFTDTAYGSIDARYSNFSIYGAEMSPVRLVPYSQNHSLVPWPGSGSMLALESAPTGGSYMRLYRHAPSLLKEQRNFLGKITAKTLTGPPDYTLRRPDGTPMQVNSRTLTFSDSGNWLLAESYDGFVRINSASLNTTYFARKLFGSTQLQHSQVALSKDGRLAAIVNKNAEIFKIYDLEQCSRLAPVTTDCPAYNYWPAIKNSIPGVLNINSVRFVTNSQLSFVARDAAGESTYRLAPDGKLGHLLEYLALGDSFSSGEGAYGYIRNSDTVNNGCHHSSQSYPHLITNRLYSSAAGDSIACSGAKINDILPGRINAYKGQVRNGVALSQRSETDVQSILSSFTPGHLPQSDFVTKYQPRHVTVSIGGNDIGFGKIILECVSPHLTRHINNQNICYDTYEDRQELAARIDSQKPRLNKLLRALQSKSPASRIYVIGYPQLAVDDGNCALNVQLSTGELAFSIELITRINSMIRQVAAEAGVAYVDISDALKGHRLCESSRVAVHGITYGDDAGINIPLGSTQIESRFLGKESYHPNAYGQELIAEAIIKGTQRFTVGSPGSPTQADGFLDKPKTGRPTVVSVSADLTQSKLVKPGGTLSISLEGMSYGLRPNSTYSVGLGSDSTAPGHQTVTDDIAAINIVLPVPADTPPGGQTIEIIGENQAGQPIKITDPIYIVVRDDDYDGDGIPNAIDSCPTIINSGIDTDSDLIDDICDSQLEIAPEATPPVVTEPTETEQPLVNSPNAPPDSPDPLEVTGTVTTTVLDTNGTSRTTTRTPHQASKLAIQGGALAHKARSVLTPQLGQRLKASGVGASPKRAPLAGLPRIHLLPFIIGLGIWLLILLALWFAAKAAQKVGTKSHMRSRV